MAWDTPTLATVGQVLTAAFWNAEVKGNMDYLKGALTTYTPQVDQGASTNIAKTTGRAGYTRAGDLCFVWLNLAMTGTGTAGSVVTVTLPITGTNIGGTDFVGSAVYFDQSAGTRYSGGAELSNATQVGISASGVFGNLVGNSPNLAVAASDVIRMQLVYPVV